MSVAARINILSICGLVDRLLEASQRLVEAYSEKLVDAKSRGDKTLSEILERRLSSIQLIESMAQHLHAILCGDRASIALGDVMKAYDIVDKAYYRVVVAGREKLPTMIRAYIYEIRHRLQEFVYTPI
ncbi:hypothetical protein [Hyperthermus butylicus]|uniref:Uncharacterized protein n=1 Tax=Hyperthermus butylicus (strain DSM 5456 / JCM 9403 / PLM1-5) TaxID=415426 RepID=A2BM46_HYPBU|nr:hypothetical protein [Hyperthermus butylicus]ABM81057.1 hypothetical protein Hbut_1225 [Hyperthermus butylicus DSM 5456]